MAPFKLKFRTGSSRNASQEVDNNDQSQTNQSLLNYSNLSEIGASSSTIDSNADCTSLESYGNNDRKLLLANNNTGNNGRVGYMNPSLSQSVDCVESNISQLSYDDHSSEENIDDNMERENLTLTTFDSVNCLNDDCSVREMQNSESHLSLTCTDPDCKIFNNQQNNDGRNNSVDNISNNETISSTEYLISNTPIMDTSSTITAETSTTATMNNDDNNLLECSDYCEQHLQNQNSRSMDKSRSHSQLHLSSSENANLTATNTDRGDYQKRCYSLDTEENQNQNQSDNHHHHHHQHQWNQLSNHNQNENNYSSQHQQQEEITIPEIINNKSSKMIYKAMAKQSGITCKMSDQCRCMECQGHYFDCEFDDNDHQKTDGGLGAGTPMFISEVMHGSACIIL